MSGILTEQDSNVSKIKATVNDQARVIPSPTSSPAPRAAFDGVATKKLLRKLDLNLLPFLALIYLRVLPRIIHFFLNKYRRLCYLDRTNVGNARLVNLEKDLYMKGLDYNITLSIFFPFYVAAEIPSNIMMKRYRPSLWLTVIITVWGAVMTCMGFVKNFNELLVCRVFLGIAEGGLFPGVSYYITLWYQRHECGFRIALFFSAATAAGAFGGLFARGISEMNGIGGLAGWSWIFIVEGLLTLVIGSFTFLAVNDYPGTAKFLTAEERAEVQRRLAEDSGLSDEFDMKFFLQALKDWKIWVNMYITIGIFTALYSISLFLPTILKDLGYSANKSQLMTVPPYFLACLCTIGGGFAADKARQRGVFLLGFLTIAISGFGILIGSEKPHVRYAGTFFAALGIFPSVPLVVTWNSNNIGGSLKRGVGIAMQVGFGNLGGVIASFVYLSRDAPRFLKGHAILIGLCVMSYCLTALMMVYYRRENARRDAEGRDLSPQRYDELKWQHRERGDDAAFFRYTV